MHLKSIIKQKNHVETENLNTWHSKYFVAELVVIIVVIVVRKHSEVRANVSPPLFGISACVLHVVVPVILHYVAFAMQMLLCFFLMSLSTTTTTTTKNASA